MPGDQPSSPEGGSASAAPAAAAASLPHNPNRGGAPADLKRPYLVQHPLFTYTTTVPVRESLVQRFANPLAQEKDFTASPPLLYAHAAPVEECVQRHLTKYPHPSQPDILACPVVSDETDPVTGVRTRKRKVVCANIAPWIMRRALGSSDTVQLSETNVYDPRTREFTLHSQNDNYTGLVVAREASRFAPHPDNPQWTMFVQYGGIRCSSYLGPLKRPIERFICDRMTRGGLEAADLLDDMINSQSPF